MHWSLLLSAGLEHLASRYGYAFVRATARARRLGVALFLAGLCLASPARGQSGAPEQRYFDWTDLPFADDEYDRRRQGIARQLLDAGGGMLLVPSRDGVSHGETFRQLDDFMYLTGLELPNAILVFNADAREMLLFVPDRDARFENPGRPNDFPGRPVLDDTLFAQKTGIPMLPLAQLREVLSAWASTDRPLYVNAGAPGPITPVEVGYFAHFTPAEHLIHYLQTTYGSARLENAYAMFARVRMVKSSAEIARLHAAARLTGNAIARAAQQVKPGVTERDMEAVVEAACKEGGGQRMPFAPIVKSGPNALWPWRILAAHYNRRNRAMQAGEVVIFDVGCELGYYVSDVGRTLPVSGTFTEEQKKLLDMQRAVSDAIIAAVKPGVTFADLQQAARAATPAEALPFMQVADFFGHHIGLDAGDPSLRDAPLEAGMVFTVEPWYYNHRTGQSVFLEDVILVTEQGAENLTSYLPRTPERLEMLMKGQIDLTGE
ncbi:MAG: Xaa-Pro peptidase family protein [Rhodothermales bacterium]